MAAKFIVAFGVVTLHCLVRVYKYFACPEDRNDTFLRNIGNHLRDYTAL